MRRLALAGVLLAFGPAAIAQEQSTFDFHSSFWVNLHHFLYEQAKAQSPEASNSAAWRHAVEVYRADIATHELLSRDIAGINIALTKIENASSLKDAGLDTELTTLLESAAPEYRSRWWPEHDGRNLAWIASVTPLIARHEAAMKKHLAKAFQTAWPPKRMRTDVAEYASWAGAYTMVDPTHITVSSSKSAVADDASVETLFHEASHALVDKVSDALQAEMESQKKLFERRAFWHAVLFYTAGHYAEIEMPGYRQFGISGGIFDRGWPGALPVLEKDWKPYLDGQVDLGTAVRNLVRDYAQ